MERRLIVKEISGKADFKKFADFPNQLYKDVPQFVPAFFRDDLDDWDPKKNPAFQYCEAKAFLAYRDGKIVGRIRAILSRRYNEIWGMNRMRFTQVDFIDDPEVSKALFERVENWAREKGCDAVHGPLGFCDLDREGMLVEGFDRRSMFITYYNHPYYLEHMKRLGYVKDVDWIEHRIEIPGPDSEFSRRIRSLAQAAAERNRVHKAELKTRRDYLPYVQKVFHLINEAYAPLYGVVDLNSRQIEKYANKFIPLVDPDYCCFVVNEKDELMAFGVCAPSLAEALKKCRGRLFPTGWAGILSALKKNDALDMLLMAVKPGYRGSGLNCIVLDHILQSCQRNGIRYAETGPQLELNTRMHSQWKSLGVEPHKRRRCFVKTL